MKKFFAPIVTALAVLAFAPALLADTKSDLKEIVDRIKVKLTKGEKTEAALAPELASFDTLLAAHKDEKSDDVSEIAFWKALLYVQILDQQEKGVAMLKQIQTDYPDTKFGKQVPTMIAQLEQQKLAAEKEKNIVGSTLADFAEKDLEGQPLSIASRKGKVLLIDFWATWCGPCVRELPNVIKAYEKYHAKGFEIIGVSLDDDKDKLTTFIKEKKMTWPQYFDGQKWQNKISSQYGITSIPTTYLIDKEGKVLATGLRGEALDQALEKALGAN